MDNKQKLLAAALLSSVGINGGQAAPQTEPPNSVKAQGRMEQIINAKPYDRDAIIQKMTDDAKNGLTYTPSTKDMAQHNYAMDNSGELIKNSSKFDEAAKELMIKSINKDLTSALPAGCNPDKATREFDNILETLVNKTNGFSSDAQPVKALANNFGTETLKIAEAICEVPENQLQPSEIKRVGEAGHIVPADYHDSDHGVKFNSGEAIYSFGLGSWGANGVDDANNIFQLRNENPSISGGANRMNIVGDNKEDIVIVLGKKTDYSVKIPSLNSIDGYYKFGDIQLKGNIKGQEGGNQEVDIQLHKIDKIVFAGDIKDENNRKIAESGSPKEVVLSYKKFTGVSTEQLFQETWKKLPAMEQCVAKFNADNAKIIHSEITATLNHDIQATAVSKYTKQATESCRIR